MITVFVSIHFYLKNLSFNVSLLYVMKSLTEFNNLMEYLYLLNQFYYNLTSNSNSHSTNYQLISIFR